MRKGLWSILAMAGAVAAAPIEMVYWDFDPAPYLHQGVTVDAVHGGLIHAAGFQGMGIGGNVFRDRIMTSGNGIVEFDIRGLPAHDVLHIGFLLAVIDSWDGVPPIGCCNPDYFSVSLHNLDDGAQSTTLLSTSFNNVNGFLSVDPGPDNQLYPRDLGNQIIGPGQNLISIWQLPDAAYDLGLDPALSRVRNDWTNVKIRMTAFGEGIQHYDESFAVDNLRLAISLDEIPEAVPEPSTAAFLGLGLAFLALAARRKA